MNERALTTTSYKAENLKENLFYQFRVRAMNMAGVSKPSAPSKALECKEWTITVPGAPVGLYVLEVRDTSAVVLWEPPVFDGRSSVNGYYLDIKDASVGEEVEYVFNDAIIEEGKKYTMKFDKSTGIIEMFMDSLEVTDEGTFTFNLVDGKAKGTTSLVLIGEEFRELQRKSEFERAEWVRKQGPHFVEYLDFTVTEECDVLLKCKIGNVKAETEIIWSKDSIEIAEDDEDSKKIERKDGELTFNIGKISKQDTGIYEVFLRDERGKDKSSFSLTDAGYQAVMNELFRRVKSGVTGEQLWLKINEPTEKDKGKYTMDIFDGKDGVKRVLELGGKIWEEAFEEFQRLKAAAIAERNRARVVGGLPDVVAIQEGKSLNLTGNVWGEPLPEVCWVKNEKELTSDDHYKLKFEHGKFASITIATVTTADSGKYALVVKNKYGTEAGEFTVSVYNPEEEEGKEKKD
uniref:Myomesin 1a (Skelemin) n=1 Tax=Nothobranchius kuhntae TaxID=321403 RepID=A0A1A8I2E1_NOTKU